MRPCGHPLPWEGPGGAEPFRPSGECGKDAGGLSGEGASAAPADLEILHVSQVGRIHTLIIRGNATDITNRLAVYAPILMDALPLTLEEIFIYELGGEDYEVRDIVL